MYLFSCRTRGVLTTSATKTPKPPSEVVGKTVEEVVSPFGASVFYNLREALHQSVMVHVLHNQPATA
jgi:hypothetical protein